MTNDIFAFETFASNRPSSIKQGTTHNDPKKSTKSQKKKSTATHNDPKNHYNDPKQSEKFHKDLPRPTAIQKKGRTNSLRPRTIYNNSQRRLEKSKVTTQFFFSFFVVIAHNLIS